MKQLIRPRLEPDCRDAGLDKDEALISIAISLKRFVDLAEKNHEEASKPRLELMPEGYVSDQDHRRILREGLAEDNKQWTRIADALWGIEGTAGLLHLLNPLDVRNNY